jgi:hypothetical protein
VRDDGRVDIYDDLPEHERPGRRPAVDAPPAEVGRGRRATDHEDRGTYRALRKQFMAKWAAEQAPC